MGNIEFGIPSTALVRFGNSAMHKMSAAKRAGFAFLEVFLLGSAAKEIRYYRALARLLGLQIRFHDGWAYSEGYRSWINYFAHLLGYLPKELSESRIQWIAENVVEEPCVVYAEHARWCSLGNKVLLQTYSTTKPDGFFRIGFEEFAENVRNRNFRVVFNTQHILEMIIGTPGIRNFREYSAKWIQDRLIESWRQLRPHVAEIHLCDSRPTNSLFGGCNVWPGTGILPLKEFCREVIRSEWSGPVSIEVTPWPYTVRKLRKLRETAEQLFSI